MSTAFYHIETGDDPLAAAAVHDGHAVREEIADLFALSDQERLREEDPFTGRWASTASTRIVGRRSRFEVDLNRPREKAVYLLPEDAWGLTVWRTQPSQKIVEESLALYDGFYRDVHSMLTDMVQRHGRAVVFDLHSYNHRRAGPDKAAADQETHPEVNLGTRTMDRAFWAPVVERFLSDLRAFDFGGRKLDVRENVKFFGGHFPRFIHESFPSTVCALSIEFKKFFMDEWTGQPDEECIAMIGEALQSTAPGVIDALESMKT